MAYDIELFTAWKKGFGDYTEGRMNILQSNSAGGLPYAYGTQEAVAFFLGCGAARHVKMQSRNTCGRCYSAQKGARALECMACAEALPGLGIQPAVASALVAELQGKTGHAAPGEW